MSMAQQIAATYRGPGAVLRAHLARGRREDLALRFLLVACGLLFVAQAPWQAREAHLDPTVPLQARLYWSAFFYVFLLPFVLYVLAFLVGLMLRFGRAGVTGFQVRLSLFWALLAATPLALLAGLVAGLIGTGLQLQIVVALWAAAILFFFISGLREAHA